jgi:NUMOD4 motif
MIGGLYVGFMSTDKLGGNMSVLNAEREQRSGMNEEWRPIPDFDYSVSNFGRIRSEKSGRILALVENQYGVVCVGMMKDGEQRHRSVPLLVARAFLESHSEAFDTPINLDGDRHNNHISNLAWRPRWFAIKYNQQFRNDYKYTIPNQIEDVRTGEISQNSFECAKRYGLLEEDLVLSIFNRTYVWPTYQEFRAIPD